MVDTNRSGARPIRHDAETFRVATELISLSSRSPPASARGGEPNDSPSNLSGFFEHSNAEKRKPTIKLKAKAPQRTHRTSKLARNQSNMKTHSSRKVVRKSSDRDGVKQGITGKEASTHTHAAENIINSRCDLSQSELLKEHRVRFRRVRRRWNNEQHTKKQEYLARFHVQGIPLVQHLEALTHWR